MHRKPASNLLPWLLVLVLVAFLAPVAVAEEEKKEEPKTEEKAAEPAKAKPDSPADPVASEKTGSEVEVFTNEDLDRLFGGAGEEETVLPPAEGTPADGAVPAEAGPGEPAQPADPLQWMQDRSARAAERQQQIAEAEAAVSAATRRVADLEKRLLALRNPFMARPEIPDDEREEWDGQGAKERVDSTEEQLQQAREELQTAEQELARLRSQT
jgi:hypothetical protein